MRALPILACLLLAAPAFAQGPAQAPQRFALPNGLQALLFEDHEEPLIRVQLRLELDPPSEEPQAGMRRLGFGLLEQGGSGHRSRAAFDQAQDALGIRIQQQVSPGAATWSFMARSRDQDLAMNLLADLVLHPVFDGAAMEKARAQAWGQLQDAGAADSALRRFQASLDGEALPEEKDLARFGFADLGRWHRRSFHPDRATLAVSGDLDLEQAKQLLTLAFGAWTEDVDPAHLTKPPAPGQGPFLAVQAGVPTELRVGLAWSAEDRAARALLLPWLRGRLAAQDIEALGDEDAFALRLRAGVGSSATALSARADAALKAIGDAGLGQGDLDRILAQRRADLTLLGLHPEQRMEAALDPARGETALGLDAANAALRRWIEAANRRVFAQGDAGALAGLAPVREAAKAAAKH